MTSKSEKIQITYDNLLEQANTSQEITLAHLYFEVAKSRQEKDTIGAVIVGLLTGILMALFQIL